MVSKKTYEERRVSSISPKTAELLIAQIGHELYNHNLYKTFANYFAVKGLHKLEEYYTLRAGEELEHHTWIVDRLNYADVSYKYPAIPEVDAEIKDEEDTFLQTLDKEIETTELIYNIVNTAKEEKDWETVYWLQETLVNEQTEEEHISRKFLKTAKQDTDWIAKEEYILDSYNESSGEDE
ncbi:ferritin [Methanobrevibacter filiformis]|uniref:Ferritin n=1 Tax=Methanobrevibacter filiformis TaxID=55758 RepID=A0A166F1P2_9EURY|nr:ferritin-like domain-containing protein [Methanobrevibacter filiformis]KZX17229.1 ferritin [Methanobrevibacter filiformis]